MYSLLIVDDETDIVESIVYDIPWEDIGISELYCAYDGEQALKLAEEKRIDVVLSDIQMPKLNGILLAEQLRRRFDHTKIIFMTGFDRFEYAREAVEYGVFRYILKPASNEELISSVAAALDEVRSEIEKKQALENVEQQLIYMKPFIIQRIMNYYITAGRIGMRQAIGMAGDAGILINPDDIFTLLVLRIDQSGKGMDTEKNRMILNNLVQKLLLQDEPALLFDDLDFNLVIILYGQDKNALVQKTKRVEEIWDIFQQSANHSTGLTVSVFISGAYISFGELPISYLEIRKTMLQFQLVREGILTVLGKSNKAVSGLRLSVLSEYPSFSLLVDTLDLQGALDKLTHILNQAEAPDSITGDQILQVYYEVSGTLLSSSRNRGINLSDWADGQEGFFYGYDRLGSFTAFRSWCFMATEAFIRYASDKITQNNSRLVEQAKQIIIKSIMENISVAELANKLFISSSHLTRVFRHETGMSVIEYMLKRKIELAKEMLTYPGAKVYETALALGYTSLSHFNRIFQRYTGCTPKEYQTGSIKPRE